MITIAVIAQKGGVGKTSSAHAIGVGLAKYHAAKVLFIDTDAQGNLSRTMEADSSGMKLPSQKQERSDRIAMCNRNRCRFDS